MFRRLILGFIRMVWDIGSTIARPFIFSDARPNILSRCFRREYFARSRSFPLILLRFFGMQHVTRNPRGNMHSHNILAKPNVVSVKEIVAERE